MTGGEPWNYRGLPVLVAGATGLLGSHVAEELAARGAWVRATWHSRPPVVDRPGVEHVQCDLGRLDDCLSVCDGMAAVFMCSGIVGGGPAILGGTLSATRTLVLGTQLLEAAAAAGTAGETIRVGVVSSTTVYPLSGQALDEEEGFAGDPFEDYFGLGWCNRAIEKTAEFLHRRKAIRAAIIRPTAIYGARDPRMGSSHAHVLPALIHRVESGETPLTVWGDGGAVRDFVHARDVARALVDAVALAPDAVPINVGSECPVTIRQAAEAVLAATGRTEVPLSFDPSKPTTIPYRVVSTGRARARLGFVPRVGLEEGLRETVAWYRAQQGG
ncbi:NAD-dependent epimerase/dehydratase family protein [Azospirillum melinis]